MAQATQRSKLGRHLRRAFNAWQRLRHGIRVRSESVSPLVENDLFLAHLSIYQFAAQLVPGRRVLDLGCGAGYGTNVLRTAGAIGVLGIDLDRKAIAFARRRYQTPGVTFRVADAQRLPPDLGEFDVIVSSNVFEHLPDPGSALAAVVAHLAPDGYFLLVVPPITDEASLEENLRNRFHVSNLFIHDWYRLLAAHFAVVRCFQHLPRPGFAPDFSSPFPSRFSAEDFEFREISTEQLGRVPSLGATFLCQKTSAGAVGRNAMIRVDELA